MYGKELILDLKTCNPTCFTRDKIQNYFIQLCDLIGMERCDMHFWDYADDPIGYADAPDHLKGVSAVQFITTSNIMIHTLDVSRQVLINVFSCNDFDGELVTEFSATYFEGIVYKSQEVIRGIGC